MIDPDVRHIFAYGTLRPDDVSGASWTRLFNEGTAAQPATLPDAALFRLGTYAAVAIPPPPGFRPGAPLCQHSSLPEVREEVQAGSPASAASPTACLSPRGLSPSSPSTSGLGLRPRFTRRLLYQCTTHAAAAGVAGVHGFVLSCLDPAAFEEKLFTADHIEGYPALYDRCVEDVVLHATGLTVSAIVYHRTVPIAAALRARADQGPRDDRATAQLEHVPCGDWEVYKRGAIRAEEAAKSAASHSQSLAQSPAQSPAPSLSVTPRSPQCMSPVFETPLGGPVSPLPSHSRSTAASPVTSPARQARFLPPTPLESPSPCLTPPPPPPCDDEAGRLGAMVHGLGKGKPTLGLMRVLRN